MYLCSSWFLFLLTNDILLISVQKVSPFLHIILSDALFSKRWQRKYFVWICIIFTFFNTYTFLATRLPWQRMGYYLCFLMKREMDSKHSIKRRAVNCSYSFLQKKSPFFFERMQKKKVVSILLGHKQQWTFGTAKQGHTRNTARPTQGCLAYRWPIFYIEPPSKNNLRHWSPLEK